MCTDPKPTKKTDDLAVFYALLRSTSVKAGCKMLVKLTPGVNFMNVLRSAFMCTDPKPTKKTDDLTVFFALSGSAPIKAELVKLTTVD